MFIAKQGNLIVQIAHTREELESKISLYSTYTIEETNIEYEEANGRFITSAEKSEEEVKKIAMLTMTALDFIGVLKTAGLTSQQIEDYLNANLEIKHQLQYCQNVYCGIVRQLAPLEVEGITITDEMVVAAFKAKHGLA